MQYEPPRADIAADWCAVRQRTGSCAIVSRSLIELLSACDDQEHNAVCQTVLSLSLSRQKQTLQVFPSSFKNRIASKNEEEELKQELEGFKQFIAKSLPSHG